MTVDFFRRAVFRRICSLMLVGMTVFTAHAQIVAPTIHTVTIEDGDSLRLGSSFVLRFTATAGSMPLEWASFYYVNAAGQGRTFETRTPASGVITTTVTNDWPPGEYRLQYVALQSALGQSSFSPSSFLPASGPGAFAPPGPSESLFLTRFVVTGTRAYVKPVLTAITRIPSTEVIAGATLTFRPTLGAGSSALVSLGMSLRDPNGRSMSFNSKDTTQISVPVPTYWANGSYTIEYVNMLDEAGVTTTYYRTGQIGNFPGPVVHNVAFSAAEFSLSGGMGSYVFPSLVSYALTTSQVKVGETVSVDFTLTPGTRSLKTVAFTFKGPVSNPQVIATASGAAGKATAVIPAAWVSGAYTLDRIDIIDVGDYQVYYQSNGIRGFSPSLKAPDFHTLNLAATRFTLADGIAPIPFISSQPEDVTADAGRTVELKIGATSPGGVQLQWYEGAVGDTSHPVQGNSSTLTVQALTNTTYWVRAYNFYGSVDSRAASVTPRFTTPTPVFLYQPQSIGVGVGNGGALTASVAGAAPLSFQWYKNGEPIAGATTARFFQEKFDDSHAGTYYLEIRNPNGVTRSDAVQVVVLSPPKILSQSQNRTVRVGDRVTFDATATGGNLIYTWSGASYGGSSGSTFTIENVTSRDARQYSVTVRNDYGSVTGPPVTLTVRERDAPVMAYLPSELNLLVGQSTGFFVGEGGGGGTASSITVSGAIPPGLVWQPVERLFNGAPTQPGTYSVTFTATNEVGSDSRVVPIRVLAQPFAPIFVTQPRSQTVYVDQRVTFSAKVDSPTSNFVYPTYQWKRDGVAVGGGGDMLELYAARLGDAGVYTLEVRSNYGTTVSQPAILTVLPAVPLPTITTPPQSQTVAPGTNVTLTVAAASSAPLTYQWSRNGTVIEGATRSALTLTAVEAPQSGLYTVEVANPTGKVKSAGATLALSDIVPGHLTNLSVRSLSAPGDRTLIAGFSVSGARSKPLLLRLVGDQLRTFGVSQVLANPKMIVMRGAEVVGVNDDWKSTTNTFPVTETSTRLGAFALSSTLDSALTLSLDAGPYSIMGGTTQVASGTVLIELYDAEDGFGRISSRLANVSARSQVGTGAEVLITGFVIAGQTPCRLLVRGIGPGLTPFGVSNVLASPRLQIYRGSTVVTENTGWTAQAAEMTSAAQSVGAFALRAADRDAGMVTSLDPGTYTVVLSGVGGATGIGLIELYALP